MADRERTKERGPVEELISKRLRPINKKIQRFKGYAAQDPDSLNADQRAAVKALPQLEAVSRELDELSKQVEEAELVASSRARELREADDRELESRVQARVTEWQLSVASQVGSFLSLHSLLRPARPDDQENLTFAPLSLPTNMQDEVLATDILRVARMYDDLISGGDAAHAVLVKLVSGPKGDDEEDDRVHRLLELLASAEPDQETDSADAAAEAQSTVPEPPQSVRESVQDTELGTSEGTPSLMNGNSNGSEEEFDPQRTPMVGMVGLRAFEEPPVLAALQRGMPLNFLQEDELAEAGDETIVIEESYEVIEPASTVMSSAAESLSTTPAPRSASFAMDWSADDEHTEEDAAELMRSALASGTGTPARPEAAAAPPAAETEAAEPVDAVTAAVAATGLGPDAAQPDVPREKKDGKQRERKPRKPKSKEQREQREGEKRDGEKRDGEKRDGEKKGEKSDKDKAPGKGKPPVDEDGFEIKTARRPSAVRGRGQGRGRGGGRGGAPRDGRLPNGAPKDAKDKDGKEASNGKGKPKPAPKEPKEAAAPKPKPSIYKTVQPTAPASAPIL